MTKEKGSKIIQVFHTFSFSRTWQESRFLQITPFYPKHGTFQYVLGVERAKGFSI